MPDFERQFLAFAHDGLHAAAGEEVEQVLAALPHRYLGDVWLDLDLAGARRYQDLPDNRPGGVLAPLDGRPVGFGIGVDLEIFHQNIRQRWLLAQGKLRDPLRGEQRDGQRHRLADPDLVRAQFGDDENVRRVRLLLLRALLHRLRAARPLGDLQAERFGAVVNKLEAGGGPSVVPCIAAAAVRAGNDREVLETVDARGRNLRVGPALDLDDELERLAVVDAGGRLQDRPDLVILSHGSGDGYAGKKGRQQQKRRFAEAAHQSFSSLREPPRTF